MDIGRVRHCRWMQLLRRLHSLISQQINFSTHIQFKETIEDFLLFPLFVALWYDVKIKRAALIEIASKSENSS